MSNLTILKTIRGLCGQNKLAVILRPAAMQARISYRHSPQTSPYQYGTIPDRLAHWARTRPNKDAYIYLGENGERTTISCAELYKQSKVCAEALVTLGVEKGDIVALIIPNSVSGLVCNFGALMAGAITYNIFFQTSDGSDVIELLRRVGDCTTLIVDPGTLDANWRLCQRFMDTISPDGSASSTFIPGLKYYITTTAPRDKTASCLSLAELLASAGQTTDPEIVLPRLDPDDIAVLFSTSGSTGIPKAVSHTHFKTLEAAAVFVELTGLSDNDIFYNDRILPWVAGYPLAFLMCGLTTVSTGVHFDTMASLVEFTMNSIDSESCNIAFYSAAAIHGTVRYLQNTSRAWRVDRIVTGSMPIGLAMVKAAFDITDKLILGYGMSECTVATSIELDSPEGFVEYTAGYAVSGTEIKVIDDIGHVVKPNARGQLCVRSPKQFLHYYNQPGETKKAVSASGWFQTGDIGYMREDGLFVCEGRLSDQIVCGGAVIYPAHLEHLIRRCPDVADAMVVGIPDEIFFQNICACVLPKQGTALTPEDVLEFCEKYLLDKVSVIASSRPHHFLLFEEFPTLATGKVSRKMLSDQSVKRLKQLQ
jgi:fatty-acyl-CoA synthase